MESSHQGYDEISNNCNGSFLSVLANASHQRRIAKRSAAMCLHALVIGH
jgi:hypothetical protein